MMEDERAGERVEAAEECFKQKQQQHTNGTNGPRNIKGHFVKKTGP